MIHQLLNTMYVQTQGAYCRLKQDTVVVEVDGSSVLRVPLHHLGAIGVFGNVLISPFLLGKMVEDGRHVAWFTAAGRFIGALRGPTSGNVLLRRAQHQALDDPFRVAAVARRFALGKIKNARHLLTRAARDADRESAELTPAMESLRRAVSQLDQVSGVDQIRGVEGNAAATYFSVFQHLIREPDTGFTWDGRSRRPPRDPLNALLSFAYTLLVSDCIAACDGVGLDPQMGFLHTLRPGRPSLALDLAEEFRPVISDRMVVALINRKQIQASDFDVRTGGAVQMTDDARKTFLQVFQQRKQTEVLHPVLDQRVPVGLLPHVQARLLARHLRGDMEEYAPFELK